ncbi:IS701 family transposase, partial [Arthrobacter sp. ISL-5]|nr:IS701 family transposase [Arthrobacter sp. ISL-5]
DRIFHLPHPQARPIGHLASIAGVRWSIEETFQTAKGEAGLDHYQVRQYTGWYRHVTLAMLAHAFLTAVKAKKGAQEPDRTAS